MNVNKNLDYGHLIENLNKQIAWENNYIIIILQAFWAQKNIILIEHLLTDYYNPNG